MMLELGRRCGCHVAAVFSLILFTIAPAWAGEECSGCTLLGELSVELSTIEPEQPQVGDEVTFTFSVFSRLPSFFDCEFNGECTFVGGPPELEGDEQPTLQVGGIVVRRRAVEAGVATVQLDLRAETEEVCRVEDEFGCQEFFERAFITASTGPIEVDIQQSPTPTPTVTPMGGPVEDDDGCAIIPPRRTDAGAFVLLLFPALLTIARRR